jgi:hypothetical protein
MAKRLPEQPIQIAEIDLGTDVLRVELKMWNGRALISAWRFYRNDAGELRPTKHGIACSLERLPKIADALNAALEKAREIGAIE